MVERCLDAEPENRPSFDVLLEELMVIYREEVTKENGTSSANLSRMTSSASGKEADHAPAAASTAPHVGQQTVPAT